MADKIKRRFIRFSPGPTDSALIELHPGAGEFNPHHVALILSESHGGCGLVTTAGNPIKKGDSIRVKVGEIHPLLGRVAWVKEHSEHIKELGVEFLE